MATDAEAAYFQLIRDEHLGPKFTQWELNSLDRAALRIICDHWGISWTNTTRKQTLVQKCLNHRENKDPDWLSQFWRQRNQHQNIL